MTAQNLPAEIYLQIFCLLDRNSLKNCLRVCKGWQLQALLLYYEEISLSASNILLAKSQLSGDEQDLDCYFQHCVWTKKLTIRNDCTDVSKRKNNGESDVRNNKDDESDEEESYPAIKYLKKGVHFDDKEFLLLLSYLPNLETFDASTSTAIVVYLTCLHGLNTSEHLLHIKDIPSHKDNWFIEELHFLTCLNFCQTVTHLFAFYSSAIEEIDNKLDFLPQFTHLTYLDFNNVTDVDLTTFDIQKICSNLIQLRFDSKHPVPENQVNTKLTSINLEVGRIKRDGSNANKIVVDQPSPLYYNRNLKVLELVLNSLPAVYIQYITTHLPRHLDTLLITLQEIELFVWMITLGLDAVIELVNYLGGLNNARLAFSFHHRFYERIPSEESKITRFHRMLGVLKKNRILYCYAEYSECNWAEVAMRVKDSSYMAYRYVLSSDDYNSTNEDNNEEVEQTLFHVPIPDISKSIIGPEIINHLSFTMIRRDKIVPYKTLKYALVNCPHLQFFELDFIKSSPLYKIRASPLELNNIGKCDPLSSTQDNLKKIRFKGVSISNDILDLLSTYLPNVEAVVFADLGLHVKNLKAKNLDGLVLDMTGLKGLKRFYLDIRTIISGEFDGLFIHFKYWNMGEQNDCYYSVEQDQSLKEVSIASIVSQLLHLISSMNVE